MKHLCIIIALLLLAGCASHKTVTLENETKDSVLIETRIEQTFIRDTVFLEIPAQTAERTTFDTVSVLENDYAFSEVSLHRDGSFTHTLNSKPQQKPVEFQKPVERRDSVIYRERTVTEQVPVPVERELSWWEKTCVKWFPWSLLFLGVVVIVYNRSWLFSLIRRLI